MKELFVMGCFISEKRHPYWLWVDFFFFPPRIHMSLRKQMFLVRSIVRITGNVTQPHTTFPSHPSRGGIIILIKFSFASNFRLEILSKATFLFNSLNNLLQLHLCWPLVHIIFSVLYPYDHFISFHPLLIFLLHISTSLSPFIFFPSLCY